MAEKGLESVLDEMADVFENEADSRDATWTTDSSHDVRAALWEAARETILEADPDDGRVLAGSLAETFSRGAQDAVDRMEAGPEQDALANRLDVTRSAIEDGLVGRATSLDRFDRAMSTLRGVQTDADLATGYGQDDVNITQVREAADATWEQMGQRLPASIGAAQNSTDSGQLVFVGEKSDLQWTMAGNLDGTARWRNVEVDEATFYASYQINAVFDQATRGMSNLEKRLVADDLAERLTSPVEAYINDNSPLIRDQVAVGVSRGSVNPEEMSNVRFLDGTQHEIPDIKAQIGRDLGTGLSGASGGLSRLASMEMAALAAVGGARSLGVSAQT